MNFIKQKFESISDIRQCQSLLCCKELQNEVSLFLNTITLDNVSPKIFLSSFYLFHFHNEILEESDKPLLDSVIELMNCPDEQLREKIIEYSLEFEKW